MKVAFLVPDNRDESRRWDDPEPYFGTAPTALLEGFAELPEVEVHVLCCVHRKMRAPAQLGRNIFYHAVPVSRPGWRALYAGCVLALRRKLHEIQPDLVHGQGTERYCALAAVFSERPNVITIHGNMRAVAGALKARPFSHPWLAARLEAYTLPRTGGVVCLSSYTKAQVGALAQRTWVVPNAVDTASYSVPRSPTQPPVVLCLANIAPYKNQVALIRALEPLASRMPFELRFAGGFSPAEDYGREFRNLVDQRPWCRHLGFVAGSGLKRQLTEASVLVLPSLEDNCPMVVLESMAAGLPVVAARVGGVPDLVAEGRTGLLCDPRDATSMRTAVERVLQDAHAATQMAAQAQQEAKQRFHPTVIARRHLEIYREVVRG